MRGCVYVLWRATLACVIVDTFSVKLQTNGKRIIEENEIAEVAKKFIKRLGSACNDSVHRDRPDCTVVFKHFFEYLIEIKSQHFYRLEI